MMDTLEGIRLPPLSRRDRIDTRIYLFYLIRSVTEKNREEREDGRRERTQTFETDKKKGRKC